MMRMRLWSWRQRPSASAMVTVVLPVPPLKLIAAMTHLGNSVLAIARAPPSLGPKWSPKWGTVRYATLLRISDPQGDINAARPPADHTGHPIGDPYCAGREG